jgi:hypothetical protein
MNDGVIVQKPTLGGTEDVSVIAAVSTSIRPKNIMRTSARLSVAFRRY